MRERDVGKWRRGLQANKYRQPLEDEKAIDSHSSRRNWPCPHLDLSSVKLISDL